MKTDSSSPTVVAGDCGYNRYITTVLPTDRIHADLAFVVVAILQGSLPSHYCIFHLDLNDYNCTPENLFIVSKEDRDYLTKLAKELSSSEAPDSDLSVFIKSLIRTIHLANVVAIKASNLLVDTNRMQRMITDQKEITVIKSLVTRITSPNNAIGEEV